MRSLYGIGKFRQIYMNGDGRAQNESRGSVITFSLHNESRVYLTQGKVIHESLFTTAVSQNT